MIAVLTVFANHLWGWPRGGFVGVDVFFVISGFLITGNLLRTAETTGTISFTGFYWKRVRRIVPAATVVLIVTYVASTLVFVPLRAHLIGIDALFAFLFAANWHFAVQGTDYFARTASVTPIQHYWSLSIEEQFYFVWPALILLISVLVIRKGWTHTHRMQLAGGIMSVIVAASLAWAIYETQTSPAFAYFNTFARVWELGVGALLATSVALLAQIPDPLRPVMSWLGIALIFASLILVGDDSVGFPAPWAVLPVAGAAFVIAAGVGSEPKYLGFLRNPISTYIGDISYSLYLVHWPVIVIMGALMDPSLYFYLCVTALSFGLAIASYHLVEDPLRRANTSTSSALWHQIRKRRYWPAKASQYAFVGAMTLMLVALCSFMLRPDAYGPSTPPPVAVAAPSDLDPSGPELNAGPAETALQGEISEALQATTWPQLSPPMETAAGGSVVSQDISRCHTDTVIPPKDLCSWGSPTAPIQLIVVGDSTALGYAGPLRQMALDSNGQMQVYNMAMSACSFADDLIDRGSAMLPNCAARKQYAVDYINQTKPSIVVIGNLYQRTRAVGDTGYMGTSGWYRSTHNIVEKFRNSVGKLVVLSSPAGDADVEECTSKLSSVPADCIGAVNDVWNRFASAEKNLVDVEGGIWIDARPWFCNKERLCPSFVGTTPAKRDEAHMTPEYGVKISPVIHEALTQAGVF